MKIILGPDDQATLMLCSQLGLATGAAAVGLRPYTLSEWNRLARLLRDSALERPGSLLGMAAAKIASTLGVTANEADRLAALLERGGLLAIELERLDGRGIWAITRASADYPARLRRKLRDSAPPVLFGAGDVSLCGQPALAVVGSRNVDAEGAEFASDISRQAARGHVAIVSGAARGVDSIALETTLAAGGSAIGVPADSLERVVRSSNIRSGIAEGSLVLLTPYHPKAPFSIGAAMGRNKVIYGLANWGLVVAAEREQGGTWAGAVEALRAGWGPVFVRLSPDSPAGNRALLERGALPFPSLDRDEGLAQALAYVRTVASFSPEAALLRDGDCRAWGHDAAGEPAAGAPNGGSEPGAPKRPSRPAAPRDRTKGDSRQRGRRTVLTQGELPLLAPDGPLFDDDPKAR